jgi:nitrogen fixation protein FixH
VPSRPFAETRQIEDLRVGLEVAPAGLGMNEFVVTVQDAQGAPVNVQKVVLSLEMTTMDMGVSTIETQPQGDGRYVAPESWVSMVGNWNVKVTVRRADADDLETEFAVPVGG